MLFANTFTLVALKTARLEVLSQKDPEICQNCEDYFFSCIGIWSSGRKVNKEPRKYDVHPLRLKNKTRHYYRTIVKEGREEMLPLTLFGLCFLICRDLSEMILCSFYRCSLPAYYVVDTTLNPRGYKDEQDMVLTLRFCVCF